MIRTRLAPVAISLFCGTVAGHPTYKAYILPKADPGRYSGCTPESLNTRRSVWYTCTRQGSFDSPPVLWSAKTGDFTEVTTDGHPYTLSKTVGLDNSDNLYFNIVEPIAPYASTFRWSNASGFWLMKTAGGAKWVSTNGTLLFEPGPSQSCPSDPNLAFSDTNVMRGRAEASIVQLGECTYLNAKAVNNFGTVAGENGTSRNRDISYGAALASPFGGTLLTAATGLSIAADVNDDGVVVGYTSNWPGIGSHGWYFDTRANIYISWPTWGIPSLEFQTLR